MLKAAIAKYAGFPVESYRPTFVAGATYVVGIGALRVDLRHVIFSKAGNGLCQFAAEFPRQAGYALAGLINTASVTLPSRLCVPYAVCKRFGNCPGIATLRKAPP
jgi:hypothetical protein